MNDNLRQLQEAYDTIISHGDSQEEHKEVKLGRSILESAKFLQTHNVDDVNIDNIINCANELIRMHKIPN